MKASEAKYVYVIDSNCIGVILDKGLEPNEYWYRTDSDGIEYSDNLIFLYTKEDVRRCKKQLKAHIAPSTSKMIFG